MIRVDSYRILPFTDAESGSPLRISMQYLDKIEKPYGLDLEVRADLALQLSTVVTTDNAIGGPARAYTFRIMHCILSDDGSRYAINPRTDLVKVLREKHPALWANVRKFLISTDLTCEHCGHHPKYHKTVPGKPDHKQQPIHWAGDRECTYIESSEPANKLCDCTGFEYKKLPLK